LPKIRFTFPVPVNKIFVFSYRYAVIIPVKWWYDYMDGNKGKHWFNFNLLKNPSLGSISQAKEDI